MNGSDEVPIGYMSLSTLYASNKRATINDTTTFYITDQEAFGRFTSAMITSQNFTWKLQSNNLNVQAMKFPTAHGISFNKLVTINGAVFLYAHRLGAAQLTRGLTKARTVSTVTSFSRTCNCPATILREVSISWRSRS
jgi:hypothetical protein